MVRRRGPGRPRERHARGGGGGCRLRGPDHGVAGRPALRRGRAGPRAGARHLRAPRRPHRRHVDGHRDGLRALRAGHAPLVLGAAPRGDPARDEPPVRARHRERARSPRPPDALRGPRVLPSQGGPGPRAVPRRGCLSGGPAPGRSGDRVPRGGRRGDDPARSRRRRGGRAVARPGGRGGFHGPVARPLDPARDLARHRPGARRGCSGHARPSGEGRRDGDRGRPGIRAVRGACPPCRRGGPARRTGGQERHARPGSRRSRRAIGGAGQGGAAASARSRAVGRARRRRARDGRSRARRSRRRRHRRRRGIRGPPGGRTTRTPAWRSSSRRLVASSPARRRRSRAPSGTSSGRPCRASPRAPPTKRSASGG